MKFIIVWIYIRTTILLRSIDSKMSVKVGVLALQGSFVEHIKSVERVKKEQRFKQLGIIVV